MNNFVSSLLTPLKDFIFKAECFHCGNELSDGEDRVCDTCWQSLTPVHPNDFTYKVMSERFHKDGIIDEFIPLFYFEKGNALQQLAHSLKYEEITSLGTELGKRIGDHLLERNINADIIIPVPLNKRKERERGYNQSGCIARGISERNGIPMKEDIVTRSKYTSTQTHLNAEERKKNVADAFELNKNSIDVLKNKHILVVDDIITTGSTIQEVGKILKENGVKIVVAVSAGLAKLGEDS